MSNKTIFCPYCGSVQEQGNRFCSSCGADMQETMPDNSSSSSVRIVRETPLSDVDYQNINATTRNAGVSTSGNYAYGASSGGSYSSYSTSTARPYRTNKEYANIALILGIVGFFISCFLIPIIGLSYVSKAEQNHEDPSTIRIAKILNWIQIILMIAGIGLAIFYWLSFGWLYY